MSASAATPVARRGPGRPPSKPAPAPLVKKGIVEGPEDSSCSLEFSYDNPGIFKTIFTYFKGTKATEIHMRCDPEKITFFARDHTKKSRIVAVVRGCEVNWYYCARPMWIGINGREFEDLFAAIDKSFRTISFSCKHEEPDKIVILYKDYDLGKDCMYNMSVSQYEPDAHLYAAEIAELDKDPAKLEATFPLEFTLTLKQFKKTIDDVKKYSDTMTIIKLGGKNHSDEEYPLQIVYDRAGNSYRETYREPGKIHLRSTVQANLIFRSTISIANIGTIASSLDSDVRILCREHSDMLFLSMLSDKAVTIYTQTETI